MTLNFTKTLFTISHCPILFTQNAWYWGKHSINMGKPQMYGIGKSFNKYGQIQPTAQTPICKGHES